MGELAADQKRIFYSHVYLSQSHLFNPPPPLPFRYLERLTHIIVENVHFFRVMDFLCALPYASGQESENKAMLMCGLDNLDESLGEDGGDGGEVEESPLHIRINPLEYCFRKEVSAMMNSGTYEKV